MTIALSEPPIAESIEISTLGSSLKEIIKYGTPSSWIKLTRSYVMWSVKKNKFPRSDNGPTFPVISSIETDTDIMNLDTLNAISVSMVN